MKALEELYKVVEDRKVNSIEGSYTNYLFEKGLDKILKKLGEECSEIIIASKNGIKEDTVSEISDFLYHMVVLMSNEGIALEEVSAELSKRSLKVGNKKIEHKLDGIK